MKLQMKRILACSGCILLSATGCLQTPDMEYVANKERQGTLIQDQMTTDSGIPIAQQVQAPARVTHDCEKVNTYTTIRIDADVIVPDCTTIPVYKVEAMNINEETIEHYTEVLYETGELYNREYEWDYDTYPIKDLTSDQLYEIIEEYERMLESAEVTDVPELVWDEYGHILELNEKDLEGFENRMEAYLARIPESEDRTTYGSPVSYGFTSHSIKSGNGVDYEFQSAAYSGLHNGVEHDLLLYRDSMNSELRFNLPETIRLENGYTMNELKGGGGDEHWLRMALGETAYLQEPNACRYSEEEAVNLCMEFMSELGIESMVTQHVEQVFLIKYPMLRDERILGNGYRIMFGWGTEDMADCYNSGLNNGMPKMVLGYFPYCSPVENFMRYPWNWYHIYGDSYLDEGFTGVRFPSVAVFTVLDDGITDAWIMNPLKNPEMQAEHVRLMDFDQILQRGIVQLEILYGESGYWDSYNKEENRVDIEVTTICLQYARMQSPDTEGEFTMIPIWDFKTDGSQGKSILSINAIDGTVFDRQKGY